MHNAQIMVKFELKYMVTGHILWLKYTVAGHILWLVYMITRKILWFKYNMLTVMI